jgi:hypothetical protein
MEYESYRVVDSVHYPGVSFTILRMSLERRLELTRRIFALAQKHEYLQAGKDAKDKIEAAIVAAEVDRIYLEWGLIKVEGLVLDGEIATPQRLLEAGPEELCREVLMAIRSECGLSETERKN